MNVNVNAPDLFWQVAEPFQLVGGVTVTTTSVVAAPAARVTGAAGVIVTVVYVANAQDCPVAKSPLHVTVGSGTVSGTVEAFFKPTWT